MKPAPPSADSLAGLTPEQRALLMLRMRQRAAGRASREPALVPVPRPEGGLPLSFAQQRLWFQDQWQPRNPAYNIPSATRLTGRLDVAALRGALNEVVRRHESLRTSFVVAADDGRPLQVVGPPAPLAMPMVDLAALPAAVREPEVERLAEEEGERPFDLSGDRLVRAALLRCGPEEHVALITMHHIVSDGWSVGVFVGEMGALYAARIAGLPSPLPELPVQYPDFAVWQRDWLRGEVLAEQLAYWMKTLAGAPPVTELPVSRPWPAVRGVTGADVYWTLPPAQTEALKEVGRREGATLFMVFLAVLDTWLHRYSGATDLLVGTPVAGRNRAELEGLIGFFVNTLVLRADLSGDPTFLTLLARTRETAVSAQAHQDLPFEKLVEELRLERDPLRPLLVQVVLSFQNTPPLAIDLPGVQLAGLGTTSRTARYDLLLSAREHGDEIHGYLEYSTDLFDAPAAERMVGHFLALAEAAGANPEQRLSELPMLSAAEREQLAALPTPIHFETRPLHRLFEDAVARNPHAVALSFEGREISYGDLDRDANRLARHLRALGVGPEVRVGLRLERSPELIVGLLGILKAGGAYVPLDPDLPAERLAFLMADAGVRVVVTREAPSPPAPLPAPPALSPGEGRQATEGSISRSRGSESGPEPVLVSPLPAGGWAGDGRGAGGEGPAGPDNTAYVIYTSGSTGTPKGVVVRHAEVARLLAATQPWFGFGAEDVWTLFHSYAFDFSVWEIWGVLAWGGRLVIVPFWVSRSPEAFHALLVAERVTVLNQTPSAFRQLVQWERGQSETAALSLRWVIFGGEALEIPSLAPWIARHGDERPRLINMYGITETTVHVTFRRIVRADLATAPGSLLGVAIPDLQVHLLDGRGDPVPDLVPGEIHVAGDGVARGYLDRPDLTAERFVPDPWSGRSGARLYRAGDLARRLPNGDLQYLGRIDDQVKVRGFRIEPAEIEAVLRAHPAVAQAAVVAGEKGDRRRLVGFVVWKEGEAAVVAELRRFAAERLPEALVPALFVAVAELPLTANGKLDRKALVLLETSDVEPAVAGEAYEAPATAVEEALAEVWAEALGLPRVGVNDSFFALGGDSILSLRVLAKARQRGIEVSLQQLFHHPTVRELARLAEGAASGLAVAGPFSDLAAEDRRSLPMGVDLDDAYPLARLQAGMLFHSEQNPEAAVYHDVFSARLRAPFDGAKLRKTIEALTARHPVLRTSFALSGFSEPLQLVHARTETPVEIDDLRSLTPAVADAEIRAGLAAERHRGFVWSRAPLLRFHLHRLPSAPGSEILQLTLSFHHSVLDGWSAAALLSALFHDYLARLAGTQSETPSPPPVFREFVRLERAALAAEATRAFWSGQVRNAEPCFLPRWPVPAGATAGEAVDRAVPIPDAVGYGLRQVARAAGVPLKSVLLAVHMKVMGHATGRPDPCTGLVANGRPEGPGSDEALGLFLNTLPFGLPFGLRLGTETWGGLARAAFEAEREMLPHRRFPLAEIQTVAGGVLFDTLFNFVHFHVYQGLLQTPGVELLDWSGYEEVDTPFGANFQLDPAGDQLMLRLSWRDRELDPRQVDALAGWYARALEAMATASETRHAEWSLLTATERRQILSEWGDGGDTGSGGLLIHRLFEEQAARTPDRPALIDDTSGLSTTYRELNDRANRLAQWLRSQGVGLETPVGLALEPSPEQIVSFLAVLKAGGAYVPLDLTYPRERLARMVEQARVGLVIVEPGRMADLEFPGARVVGTSPPAPLPSPPLPPGEGRRHPTLAMGANLPFSPLPAAGGAMGEGSGVRSPRLAYVMFTSGSTGAPKAVAVEHRGVIRLVRGLFPSESVFLQLSPVSFDAATEEIWGALLNGGCVVLPPAGIPTVDGVARLIERHGVTSMAPSTGLFHQIALARPEILDGLLWVSVGGDVMRPELTNRVLAAAPGCGLVNGYGPTENTTHTTIHRVRTPIPAGDTVPLGRPIPGTRIAALGVDLQPVPLAVPAELYTGGEGLARGYLGRPDLTAERFVPDPFAGLAGEPGARLYRTGDRATWHPDGNLRFLGRIDRQIKVRGFRVEPGDVEAALAACPLVADAAAGARDDLPGGRGLAAYLVPAVPDPEERFLAGVRAFLQQRLPDYLIPAAFFVLPELPLTVVGKVDRQALLRLPLDSIRREERLDAPHVPRNPVEEMLAAIWTEVLGVERPGLHDDFFALGGHSLLAIQAVSRVRAVFGIEIPLPWLFEAPSIAGLAERIAGALRAEPARQAPPLVPRPADGAAELPLSFAQERLWFLEQLQPGTATYNIATAVHLTGGLDAAALGRSLAAVVARHEALRTRFPGPFEGRAGGASPPTPLPSPPLPPGEGRHRPTLAALTEVPFPPLPVAGGAMGEGGQGGEVPAVRLAQPVQVIDPPPAWVLPMVDLAAVSAARREETARSLALDAALRPFDLVAGPPLRALLVRTAEDEHLALLAMHHIVSDGWSMGLLVREMTALYRAGGVMTDADLPVLPVQYADFALWQRQWLQGDVLAEHLDFWRRRLAGAPPLLALPLDRPRPPVQAFHGDRRTIVLGHVTVTALESLGRRCGSTLFMTLLAVFDALLARWTGQSDVVVGVPSANRNRGEIENLIGFFVNSLVVRADLTGDPSFIDLVGRVRETALAAFAHQDLPFEKLVGELRPDRDLSHTPLFQVLFQLLELPPAPLELPGLTLDVPHEVESGTAKFDLVLSFERNGAGLFAEWRYNTELFDGTTVQRMADTFVELLTGILAAPERPFTAVPWLGATARHQVLIEWNNLETIDPDRLGFPDLFARQAARTPDAIAVSCDERTMTYGELAALTRRAARRLAALGVGPETVVALLAERGPDFLTVLIAILTAGGVYLPLDPSHPQQRLAGVLEQSTASWVIAGPGVSVPEGGWTVIALDELISLPPKVGEGLAPSRVGGGAEGPTAENLAYILFTSGSTGRPKGAMLTHRGLLNHLRAKIADLGLTGADVVAQNAGQTFDISIWQHLAPLLAGGRVEIFRDAVAHDPLGLLEAAERTGVSILQVVPSLLAGILSIPDRPALIALRWLIPTGEALPPGLARGWLTEYPAIPLLNAYGPTECTDEVSYHVIRRRPSSAVAITPIGRPLRNARLFVVDAALAPVPAGVAGELCIGGAGVGRGYLSDPARTAEVFVPDPFASLCGVPGARLYRTGDLARHLADGTLEYLGRRDHQVKIRGVRIETGEIAAILAEHPQVRNAVVLARPQPGGGVALAAYVVLRNPTDPADLRAFLHHRLPEVMIPSVFVELAALPLTANGKLDRRALPDPFLAGRRETQEPTAPRTPLEALVAELWAEALGPAPFGVDDNFFELGGDSIKGAVLIHRLQRRLGESLSVAALFDAPTVARFAAYLKTRYPPVSEHLTPLVHHGPEAGPPPLSFAQERLWFLQQLEPEGSAYNMPLAFRMRGLVKIGALDRALVEVVRRHETLRTRFVIESGRPVPLLDPPPDRLLAVVDLAALPAGRAETEARHWIAAEAQRPFDLERGPVVRSLLLRLNDHEAAALFVAHHVACDGWSLGLWAHEVGAHYRSEVLPELPVQYGDFARWQRRWMEGGTERRPHPRPLSHLPPTPPPGEGRQATEDVLVSAGLPSPGDREGGAGRGAGGEGSALASQVAWWRERLAGLPPSLDLPADRPRPPIQTVHGASVLGLVPAAVADALRSLGQRHGASPFMVLFAAFTVLLHRLSGQDDIAVGSPIAGRTQPEVEGLIGCFLNTLVLRTDLSGKPAFPALLAQVRETALGAYAHQDVPFEKLLEDLRPQRDLSRPSIFQVLFNMLNAPSSRLDLPDLEIEGLEQSDAKTSAKFDLTLYLSERPDGLGLHLVYNTDLFAAPRMGEFLRQYRDLLTHIAERPEAPIDAWPLLTAEARAVLPDPIAPLSDAWVGAVHDLVLAQARRHPDRVALIDRAGAWTYGEFAAAVQRIATHLRHGGIRKGDRVAIHATRSAALVWTILGVLQSGAAFVILDPVYPEARLAEIVRLAKPRAVLRLDGVSTGEEPFTGWPEIGPHDIASVAFTSGSTGVPKGILQTHGSMSHFIPWHRDVLGYGEDDRHSLLSGLAHDPLHRDMFYSLTLGATLCIPDPDRIGAPGYLAAWMREQRITVTNLTPAMAQLLTEVPEPILLPDLRCAVLAGDVLTRRDVARVRRLAPQAVCINVYGATESQRALSWYRVEEGSLADAGDSGEARLRQILPLGRGKGDVQLLILTGAGLAGIGEIGEIAIRSPHLAHGYLDDLEQTRRRFVANPLTGDPADRVYLTGDLGRYLPDGAVAAAGRADQQVKIRGFRVEPGEIEAELGRLLGVREAVVVGKPARDGATEKRLVAYVVLTGATRLSDLRDALRDRLPAFMVPAVFVPLDRLPVNPNGKIDRRVLPDPEDILPAASAQTVHVPPRDEIELRLARIWEDVLETAPVGVTDDFFALGGHSLLAVRLMARIAHDLGQSLPLAALFQATTIEELARLLRAGTAPTGPLVQLRAGGTLPPLFLVHPAGGQVPCYIDLARTLTPGRPIWGLQDIAPIDTPRDLHSLAATYLEAARSVHTGPWFLAGWSFGGRVAFEMARQLAAGGDDVAFLGMIDTGLVEPPQQAERSDADILIEALGPIPVETDELRRAADPVALLVTAAQERGLLPPGYDIAEARRLLALFKTHLEIARTDRPQPYSGRLIFFAAEEVLAGWEDTAAVPIDHGWADLAAETEVVPIPGNHVTLIRDRENVRVLAEKIDVALTRRESSGPS